MIDITNLTSLITAFRQETEQGSISPETLGALLQAIANQLTSAATDQDQQKLSLLYDHIRTMGNCLTSVVQGSADRNNVLADYTFFNPITGIASAQRDTVLVRQATIERAGARSCLYRISRKFRWEIKKNFGSVVNSGGRVKKILSLQYGKAQRKDRRSIEVVVAGCNLRLF